jgi:hypothetical protein
MRLQIMNLKRMALTKPITFRYWGSPINFLSISREMIAFIESILAKMGLTKAKPLLAI